MFPTSYLSPLTAVNRFDQPTSRIMNSERTNHCSAKCTIYTHTFSFKECSQHLIFPLWPQWIVLTSNLWNYESWRYQPLLCLVQCASVRLHGRHKKICGRYENWKLRTIIWNVTALCIGIKVQLAMREPFSPSKVQFLHSRAMHYRLHSANSFDFSHRTDFLI